MNKENNYIIFYGTLQQGMGRTIHTGEETPDVTLHCSFVNKCLFKGSLYDNGYYPIYVNNGHDIIMGELWKINDNSILGELDQWEEEYDRQYISIVEPLGIEFPKKAMIYIYNKEKNDPLTPYFKCKPDKNITNKFMHYKEIVSWSNK